MQQAHLLAQSERWHLFLWTEAAYALIRRDVVGVRPSPHDFFTWIDGARWRSETP